MASVKRIEGSTVHRIQSGQVVVDLSSAVKELVENSIDAGATSIGKTFNLIPSIIAHPEPDIRFKNYGLDAIEVQDNGSGIAKDDFESIGRFTFVEESSKLMPRSSIETLYIKAEQL